MTPQFAMKRAKPIAIAVQAKGRVPNSSEANVPRLVCRRMMPIAIKATAEKPESNSGLGSVICIIVEALQIGTAGSVAFAQRL
jgi:hypothetical protein